MPERRKIKNISTYQIISYILSVGSVASFGPNTLALGIWVFWQKKKQSENSKVTVPLCVSLFKAGVSVKHARLNKRHFWLN